MINLLRGELIKADLNIMSQIINDVLMNGTTFFFWKCTFYDYVNPKIKRGNWISLTAGTAFIRIGVHHVFFDISINIDHSNYKNAQHSLH